MQGPSPFFLSSDRLLAEEFFRPGFTAGAWLTGEPLPKFRYWAMVGNNLSQLGITARQMSRDLSTGLSLWWMPTTGEFGPRGGYGDFELHEELATRFGVSFVHCREDRQSQLDQASAETQVKVSDGLLLFETNTLADGVTVQQADFDQGAIDAGGKINGWHFQIEYYFRNLSKFDLAIANPSFDIKLISRSTDSGTAAQKRTIALAGTWQITNTSMDGDTIAHNSQLTYGNIAYIKKLKCIAIHIPGGYM